jgi:hypothetical protein
MASAQFPSKFRYGLTCITPSLSQRRQYQKLGCAAHLVTSKYHDCSEIIGFLAAGNKPRDEKERPA